MIEFVRSGTASDNASPQTDTLHVTRTHAGYGDSVANEFLGTPTAVQIFVRQTSTTVRAQLYWLLFNAVNFPSLNAGEMTRFRFFSMSMLV